MARFTSRVFHTMPGNVTSKCAAQSRTIQAASASLRSR